MRGSPAWPATIPPQVPRSPASLVHNPLHSRSFITYKGRHITLAIHTTKHRTTRRATTGPEATPSAPGPGPFLGAVPNSHRTHSSAGSADHPPDATHKNPQTKRSPLIHASVRPFQPSCMQTIGPGNRTKSPPRVDPVKSSGTGAAGTLGIRSGGGKPTPPAVGSCKRESRGMASGEMAMCRRRNLPLPRP